MSITRAGRMLVPAGLGLLLQTGLVPAVHSDSFSLPLASRTQAYSASFGEYRPGHLHAGIDFATFGQTGIPVRSIASGKVIRIRSSTGGYGNCVYIEHRDGRRSTYAHLERLAPQIERLLPRPTHVLGGDKDGATMEVFPNRPPIVGRGEIIGWSGESGSGLPHLHFELRDKNDRPLNPVPHGVLAPTDPVPPQLQGVWLEPADEASTVSGGHWPVWIDSAARRVSVPATGRVRVLVSGYDEDGKLGGRLGLTRIRLRVGAQTPTTIDMRAFTYGRDKEVGKVYDLFRTGFSPTLYTYDLTGPDGAAEVVQSRGPVEMTGAELPVSIEAHDLAGNRSTLAFKLVSEGPVRPGAPRNGETITRAGLIIRRDGDEEIFSSIAQGEKWGMEYRVEIATGMEPAVRLAGGGALRKLPPRLKVCSLSRSSMPGPPQAVAAPVLIGPFGQSLEKPAELTLPRTSNANGIAILRNGTWKWLEGYATRDHLVAEISVLAPVALIRDATPPTASIAPDAKSVRIAFEDDFSGVNAESVKVAALTGGAPVELSGRFDSDRDQFLPTVPLRPGTHRLQVEAADRAGNAFREILTVTVK